MQNESGLTICQFAETAIQFRTQATDIPGPVLLPYGIGVFGSAEESTTLVPLAAD
jgi:hypothetical protein